MRQIEDAVNKTLKASRRPRFSVIIEQLLALRVASYERKNKGDTFDEEGFKARLACYLKSVEAAISD